MSDRASNPVAGNDPRPTQPGPGLSPPVSETTPQRDWEVLAGAGVILPTPATASPLFSLEGRLFLTPRWRVGLLGAFSLGGSTPVLEGAVIRGTVVTRDVLALPSFSICTDTLIRSCGGALAGLRLTLGDASGSLLFHTGPRVAPGFTAGLQLDATLPLRAFRLSVGAGVLVNPTPASFQIQGLAGTTVTTPLFEGFAHLRIGLGPGVL